MNTAKITEADIDRIARVVHEAVRAFQTAHDQPAARAWSGAPKWMKVATRDAIVFRVENPEAPASAQHDQWMRDKKRDGWTYGAVKDPARKTHPLIVDYEELPFVERQKDALVGAIIDSLTLPL